MAISFPLSLASFFEGLRLTQQSFMLGEAMSRTGETGAGELLTSGSGTRLWQGSLNIAPSPARDLEEVIADIDLLREPGASFLVGDMTHQTLRNDPTGAIADANPCVVVNASANEKELTIEGMPAGFVLAKGDHFSVPHVDGTRSYYRCAQSATFDGGFTPPRVTIEVRPHLSAKVIAARPIEFHKPALKAVYVPNSFRGGERVPGIAKGVTLNWRQTLL